MNIADQHLSVLFAGVAGSVRLHEKLGGDEAARAVDRCLTRMERAVEAFGGRVIKRVGDEFMVVFDLPDEAFQAAIEMRQRVADLPPVSGVKLAIRIGFSHGLVSEADGNIVGETVVEAAGLAGLAMPGQVLASHQAHAALSPALKKMTRDLGSASTKGQSPKGIAFEVVTQGTAAPEIKKPGDPEERQGDKPRDGKLHLRYAGK
ncbi:adenylate/guanylate cyclase domain-containing protein, partial [Candidatus Propionivibrio aalborgensis]|uniref:adenylate/guanylate cyclase domain-containing protein n=1 Tax=Candidatus Propionivibrio aalborgensis TaxID=1860101 RepID=UPI0016477ED3